MIPTQTVGHAAAVSHPLYVSVPTFPVQTYAHQTAQPTMYHTYNAYPTVHAMPYPMMFNNTNANAGYSPYMRFQ